MHLALYEKYLKDHFDLAVSEKDGPFVKNGTLTALDGSSKVPVQDFIPRFCGENYCDSFGLQWSRFKTFNWTAGTVTAIRAIG